MQKGLLRRLLLDMCLPPRQRRLLLESLLLLLRSALLLAELLSLLLELGLLVRDVLFLSLECGRVGRGPRCFASLRRGSLRHAGRRFHGAR